MKTHTMTRVVPNDSWGLVVEFGYTEHRLVDSSVLRARMTWPLKDHANKLKQFAYTETSVVWSGMIEMTAEYLYEHSTLLTDEQRERQSLSLSYTNRAPTAQDEKHHVYGVNLYPFSANLILLEESIGGGHAERGGASRMTPADLLARHDWKRHFERAGGEWAIPMIGNHTDQPAVLSDLLVREICRRAGTTSLSD